VASIPRSGRIAVLSISCRTRWEFLGGCGLLAYFLLILPGISVNACVTSNPRHFPKVEKWTRDGTKIDSLLYAGNSLGRTRSIFERAIKHRPRIRLTIR
jgi:hypothetical protein